MMRGRHAVALCVLVAACGSPAADDPEKGNVATYRATGEGGASALLSGRLELIGDCLVIATVDDSAEEVVAIFADTSSVSLSSKGLQFNGKTYPLGTEVALGGGFTDDAVGERDGMDNEFIPTQCPANLRTFIVSQDVKTLRED